MYRRILVAIDNSHGTPHVLDEALKLAGLHPAELHLVTVVNLLELAVEDPRQHDPAQLAALADPAGRRMTDGDVSAYRAAVGDAKARLFYAGLAGLGLLSEADSERMARALEVQVGGVNSWTRAIDNAARARDPGLVVLLCATGMQTRSWDHVSPEALFHVVAGLRAVGLVDYARLVAVEAVTRT